jgi:hypothetical protein
MLGQKTRGGAVTKLQIRCRVLESGFQRGPILHKSVLTIRTLSSYLHEIWLGTYPSEHNYNIRLSCAFQVLTVD